MRSLLDLALQYAKRGWCVFPLDGKKPFAHSRSFKDATLDRATIEQMFRLHPNANIGIATGGVSGIWVLDIDGEGGERGFLAAQQLETEVEETYEVLTGKGRHLYFLQPHNVATKNQASGSLGPQIDIRGDGGYVVAAGSVHPDTGKEYKHVGIDMPVLAPEWLFEHAARDKQKKNEEPKQVFTGTIKKGSRDAAVTSFAGTLRYRGLAESQILEHLKTFNQQMCDPPLVESDLRRIARSIGSREPHKMSALGTAITAEFSVEDADKIQMRPVSWRWPSHCPRGNIVLWAGNPGHGKSTLAFTFAAAVSRGAAMPGDDCLEQYEPQTVLILSAEDDKETTIKPRLRAANADEKRVKIIDPLMTNGRPASLPQHLLQLSELVTETKAGLVIIDPIDAFLGAEIDSHKNADVRRALAPLSALAHRSNAIVLLISHLNKSTQADAIARVGGSGGFVAAPRVTFIFGDSTEVENEHVFACLKINLTMKPKALRYKIESTLIENIGQVARISFQGETANETAESVLASHANSDEAKSVLVEAKQFLREELSLGPKDAQSLIRSSKALCSLRTLKSAKDQLHIKSTRVSSKFYWHYSDYDMTNFFDPFAVEQSNGNAKHKKRAAAKEKSFYEREPGEDG